MIDPKELRIGNWVVGPLNQPVQIRNGSQIDEFAYTYFPIEICEEYLLGSDFKLIHSNPRLENFYLSNQTYYPFMIYSNRDGRFYLNENSEIKSVHQIQNLFFSLMREELALNEFIFYRFSVKPINN